MEPLPHEIDPGRLFAEARWVWRLARGLVGDDQAADDVVQDTWVAALTHPPRSLPDQGALRAWLAAVVRNFAYRARRSKVRRETRERAVARPEELASVDRVVESESVRRDLVDAVLALDEPWRSTVVLRYFDDLSSAEIARRTGVPESTVRNRLRRGLAELRARLEREHGNEWRQRCLFLIPASELAIAPGLGGGALAAGVFTSGTAAVSLAALALLLVAWIAWGPREGEHPRAELAEAPPRATRALDAELESSSSAVVVASERELAEIDSLSALDASVLADLGHVGFGRVTGDGGAARDGEVTWIDATGVQLAARIDERGWYSIAGLRDGPWLVRAEADGWRPAEARVEARAQAALRQDLTLERLVLVAVRLRAPDGEPILALPESRGPMRMHGLRVVATSSSPGERLEMTDEATPARYGVGRFHGPGRLHERGNVISTPVGCVGVLEIAASLPVHASLVLRDAVLETQLLAEGTREVTFTLAPDAVERKLARASLRAVDLDGSPLAGVHVSLEPSNYYGATVETDADGRATIDSVAPGLCVLRASAAGLERYARFVDVPPGAELDLGTLRMGAGVALRGRVLDSRGEPLATTLTWVLLGDAERFVQSASWMHLVSSSSDGSFRLEDANQPPRARLLLRTQRSTRGEVGWTIADLTGGSTSELVLRTSPSQRVTLDLRPSSDRPVWWRLRALGGTPIDAAPVRGPGRVAFALPAGAYELEIAGAPGVLHRQRFEVGAQAQRLEVVW